MAFFVSLKLYDSREIIVVNIDQIKSLKECTFNSIKRTVVRFDNHEVHVVHTIKEIETKLDTPIVQLTSNQ